jgi:hypothetical protein
MDRERQGKLEDAEARIAREDRRVVKQRWVVARLERDGHDTAEARRLLAQLEESRTWHIAERDRLLQEVDK